MASTSKSQKLGLSLWEASDRPERLDFRQDNEALEQLVGGHIADDALHLTAGQKEYVNKPWFVKTFQGLGPGSTSSSLPFSPQAAFVLCAEHAPTEIGEDGKTYLYWDFWAKTGYAVKPNIGRGGLSINGKNYTVHYKQSPDDENLFLCTNERDVWYALVCLPTLS